MSTDIVYADTSDGRVKSTSSVYSTARSGGTMGKADTATSDDLAGQLTFKGNISITEGFFQFNTTVVGTDTVSAAALALTATGRSGTTIELRARLKDWGTALETGDWVAGASLSGLTLLAHYDMSSGWTAGTAYSFVDDAFAANVNGAGQTRILVSSALHEAGTNTDGLGSCYFADYAGTTYDPKLTITHAAAASDTAPAELASATGGAFNASISAKPTAGLGAGTAAAYDATVKIGDIAPAEVATATGAAYDATAAVKPTAGLATGAGAAFAASAQVRPIAPAAAATGDAYGITGSVKPIAGLAEATGAALSVTADVDSPIGTSAGTAAAFDATVTSASRPIAEAAAVTGAAYDAVAKLGANSEAAAAIAAAFDASGAVGAFAGLASAVGVAYDATIWISGAATLADAGSGGVVGAAYDATVTTAAPSVYISAPRPRPYSRPRRPLPRPLPVEMLENAFAGSTSVYATAYDARVVVDWTMDEYLLGLTDDQL